MLEGAGEDWIENRVTALRDLCAAGLRDAGYELLWMPAAGQAGIVTFRPVNGDARALYEQLDAQFALSLRQDRTGAFWIRASPHWMNTKNDIDSLLEALDWPPTGRSQAPVVAEL